MLTLQNKLNYHNKAIALYIRVQLAAKKRVNAVYTEYNNPFTINDLSARYHRIMRQCDNFIAEHSNARDRVEREINTLTQLESGAVLYAKSYHGGTNEYKEFTAYCVSNYSNSSHNKKQFVLSVSILGVCVSFVTVDNAEELLQAMIKRVPLAFWRELN